MIRQDDAEHRTCEEGEHAGESCQPRLIVAEVAERVDADEESDAGDERDHHERERVEP